MDIFFNNTLKFPNSNRKIHENICYCWSTKFFFNSGFKINRNITLQLVYYIYMMWWLTRCQICNLSRCYNFVNFDNLNSTLAKTQGSLYNLNSSLANTQGSLYVHTGKRLIQYSFINIQVKFNLTSMYRPGHNKQG